MLYNPIWEIKSDEFSLAALIAWLEMQPADRRYDYENSGSCLLVQYFRAQGYKRATVDGFRIYDGNGDPVMYLPDHFNAIANGRPWTFGGALKRARRRAMLSPQERS